MDRSSAPATGPLTGLRVIDCATILAAPLTCQILGDFGAEVIKIEHPRRPDGLRGHGPAVDGAGLWWKEVGRNKRTIGLDLSHRQGAAALLDLVRVSDVLVENFRPGTLERWGLGWETLRDANPGLVVLRVTGFGQDGPYRDRPAFGTLIEAMSGFAHLTGEPDRPPTLPAFGLADSVAGMAGAAAVVMALYHRDAQGGRGQVIDLSLLEPLVNAVGPAPTVYDALGIEGTRSGNRSANNAPRNLYRAADGRWLAVSASAHTVAVRVLTLVGHEALTEEPWFATGAGRAAHADLIDRLVGDWISERDSDEVMKQFEDAGAAIAAVYRPSDLVADPQVRHREMLTRIPDDDLGSVLQHNVLFRMSATPGSIRFTGREPGADTDDVLATVLGYDPDQIASLRAAGAAG